MELFKDGQKIKKMFNPKRGSKHLPPDDNNGDSPGKTLDRIICAKEEARKQWEETQENFEKRKREHEIKMIDMEKAEVIRREKEIREQHQELDDLRRKNRLVQDKFVAQILSLQEKLEEYKLNHKGEEESMEDEISNKEDKLAEVKLSLDRRTKILEDSSGASAPPLKEMYPTLPLHGTPASPLLSRSSRSNSPSDCSV